MPRTVKIPVPNGLTTNAGVATEVVMEEPDFDTYLELGDPVTLARAPDGTVFQVENSAIIRGYIERCVKAPADQLSLAQGGFDLARALKDAVLSFFRVAPSEDAASKTSPTT